MYCSKTGEILRGMFTRLEDVGDSMHVYEVRPRNDQRDPDLISDVLPFGRLWYTKPDDPIGPF